MEKEKNILIRKYKISLKFRNLVLISIFLSFFMIFYCYLYFFEMNAISEYEINYTNSCHENKICYF